MFKNLPKIYFSFKKHGVSFVLKNITERFLFDLINNTDTTRSLPKDEYISRPESFSHGNDYACAFTSEIELAFNFLFNRLGVDFINFSFVDIGCGKGKVLIVWEKMLKSIGLTQRVLGIEYFLPLIQVAKENYLNALHKNIHIYNGDAAKFDYHSLGNKQIIFMYNPFDEIILDQVLDKLVSVKSYIIYNNPVHAATIESHGFEKIYERNGKHMNEVTYIYTLPVVDAL